MLSAACAALGQTGRAGLLKPPRGRT